MLSQDLDLFRRPALMDFTGHGLAHCVHRSELKIEVESDDRLVYQIVSCLKEYLRPFEICTEQELIQISTALEEALLNAVIHGNLEIPSVDRDPNTGSYQKLVRQRLSVEPFCGRKVTVEVMVDSDQVEFVVRDEGCGFDPDSVPDPTNPELLCCAGGRGLLLIRAFMDEVSHNSTGTAIHMVKYKKV